MRLGSMCYPHCGRWHPSAEMCDCEGEREVRMQPYREAIEKMKVEKRDTPVAKSVLSERREADDELCDIVLWWCDITSNHPGLVSGRVPEHMLVEAATKAVARIRELSEALQEACHERDGLLATVERSKFGWSGASSATPNDACQAIPTPPSGEYSWWEWDEQRGRWQPCPAPPGEK